MHSVVDRLKNSFIKNDNSECRDLYFELCFQFGLHTDLNPDAYEWPWIYESGLGLLQHAPGRKYVRNKVRLELSDLRQIQRSVLKAA